MLTNLTKIKLKNNLNKQNKIKNTVKLWNFRMNKKIISFIFKPKKIKQNNFSKVDFLKFKKFYKSNLISYNKLLNKKKKFNKYFFKKSIYFKSLKQFKIKKMNKKKYSTKYILKLLKLNLIKIFKKIVALKKFKLSKNLKCNLKAIFLLIKKMSISFLYFKKKKSMKYLLKINSYFNLLYTQINKLKLSRFFNMLKINFKKFKIYLKSINSNVTRLHFKNQVKKYNYVYYYSIWKKYYNLTSSLTYNNWKLNNVKVLKKSLLKKNQIINPSITNSLIQNHNFYLGSFQSVTSKRLNWVLQRNTFKNYLNYKYLDILKQYR